MFCFAKLSNAGPAFVIKYDIIKVTDVGSVRIEGFFSSISGFFLFGLKPPFRPD